jgi:hypothetical protein
MGLPTKSKTWQHTINIAKGGSGTLLTDNRAAMRQIPVALTAFGTQPWTCSGSSDSSTSGMDASNRWAADTNLVWATGAHSWIVLRQTGMATKFELCVDLSNASSNSATIVISPANGFGTTNGGTDGSTTARPTATDEYVVLSNTTWNDAPGSGQSYKVHCMQSTDGQCTRILVTNNLYPISVWIIDRPKNAVTGWDAPWLVGFKASASATTSGARVADWITAANMKLQPKTTLTVGSAYLAIPMVLTQTLAVRTAGTVANDISGNWPFFPITVISESTGMRGMWGEMYDLYFGSTGMARGTGFDSSPSHEWVFVNDMIIPWDGANAMQ